MTPDLLACPTCRGTLHAADAALRCGGCATSWPIADGLPRLYEESRVPRSDRLLRRIYDGLPWLYDPLVRVAIPLLDGGADLDRMRERYLERLDLARTNPIRVLEVGSGTGANVDALFRRNPRMEYWGVDLSVGMLEICRRRARSSQLNLLVCDAHHLPFRDHSFDGVLQIGALNGFGDPSLALREMARVARPGARVVVVDEQLDATRRHRLFQRLAFRMVTFYDRDPHCPRELVPEGATDVVEEQLSRFFYCLSFRAP